MSNRWKRRASLRRQVAIECEVASDFWDGLLSLTMGDLSPEGAWLDCPYPLHVGELLTIGFCAPRSGERLAVLGEVRRVQLGRRASDTMARSGMGVLFDYISADDREMLRAALCGMPPPLPPIARGASA
ncbi:MAG: PilZ domain-containing protein [Myxococcales bacterium]|nr:PilZ domain-containing protein [Myxococcales bacterium]